MAPAASNLGVAQLLIVQLAAFLAALLWASGLHKLIRRDRARAVVHEFAGVPRRLAPFVVAAIATTRYWPARCCGCPRRGRRVACLRR